MMRKRIRQYALKLGVLMDRLEAEIADLTLPTFAESGRNLRIARPRRILNPDRIRIGSDVALGPGCLLNPIKAYPGRAMGAPADIETRDYDSSIEIGDRVSATGYLTIGAASSVVIEDDVLMASHIYIGDNQHGMLRTDVPYKYQPLDRIAPVRIGRGSWIGEHAVVLPGVTVGEFAIIGAHSVVTRDVPPRTVVAGAPARVLKQWSMSKQRWVTAS